MSLPYMGGHYKNNLWRGLLLFFLLGLAIYMLFNSSIFDVREIKVSGNDELEEKKIIDVSGLHKGTNIFKVNTGEATSNLLTIPILKEVEVERELPGLISINIQERKAVALIARNNGFIEIDNEGMHLRNTQTIKNTLPVITGVNIEEKEPGTKVLGEGLKEVLMVIKKMPRDLILSLSEINYRDNNTFIIYTNEGIQCKMGVFEEIDEKCKILQEILSKIREERNIIEYVDLSSPGEPVIKYKE